MNTLMMKWILIVSKLFHLAGEKLWNIDIANDIANDMLMFDDLKIKNTHSATLNFYFDLLFIILYQKTCTCYLCL